MSMNRLIKITKLIPLFILIILIGCNDDSPDEPITTDPTPQSRSVRMSFSLPVESDDDNSSNSGTLEHNYIYDGYTIEVSGMNMDTILYDKNLLTGPFETEVSGDVTVSIYHPDFIASNLDTGAYFGVTDYVIPSASEQDVSIDLELVQGFVLVETVNNSDDLVKSLTINGYNSDLNTYYYTATDAVTVFIVTDRDILSGTDDLEIGKGVKYVVDPVSSTFSVTFPEFGEATEGDLNTVVPVIREDNVSFYESYKLYPDGTVDIYTGGKETNIFIPSTQLEAGIALAQYDLSGLNASWKVNNGQTGYDYTAYTNIYLSNSMNQTIRVTVWANDYIKAENTETTETKTYGEQQSDSNQGTYEAMLEDYGNMEVQKNWVDSAATIGNFIWRAAQGDGTIYVESYSLEVNEAASPVVTQDNILGATVDETNVISGAVSATTDDTDASVLVLASDLTNEATLADYDIASIFTEIDVEWTDVTTEAHSGYINVYLNKDALTKVSLLIEPDGTYYVGDTMFNNLEDLLEAYGDYFVRTDYREQKGTRIVGGNFIWRSGDQRGTFEVKSFEVFLNQ